MKYAFAGCSLTRGYGLTDLKHGYPQLVCDNDNAKCVNIAQDGYSNQLIFTSALQQIANDRPDIMFVQWTSTGRHWMSPKPDQWIKITGGKVDPEKFGVNLRQFHDSLITLNCEYQHIMDLIQYCDILNKLHDRVIFINGAVFWTKDMFIKDVKYSNYTKSVLDFDNHSDDTIQTTLDKLRTQYAQLVNTQWVNQFKTMLTAQIDHATDNQHPGIESNKMYADWIIKYLEKTKIAN